MARIRIDIDLRKPDGAEVPYTKVTVLYGVRFVLAMIAVMGVKHCYDVGVTDNLEIIGGKLISMLKQNL